MLSSDSNSSSRWRRGWHRRWISRSSSAGSAGVDDPQPGDAVGVDGGADRDDGLGVEDLAERRDRLVEGLDRRPVELPDHVVAPVEPAEDLVERLQARAHPRFGWRVHKHGCTTRSMPRTATHAGYRNVRSFRDPDDHERSAGFRMLSILEKPATPPRAQADSAACRSLTGHSRLHLNEIATTRPGSEGERRGSHHRREGTPMSASGASSSGLSINGTMPGWSERAAGQSASRLRRLLPARGRPGLLHEQPRHGPRDPDRDVRRRSVAGLRGRARARRRRPARRC